jgi:anti-anti-sigma factor
MIDLARLSVERVGSAVLARIEGDVDASNALSLGQELAQAIDSGTDGLVLDLSGTRYVDSAGIRMLFTLQGQLARRAQALTLVVPDDAPIHRMLAISEVPQLIEIFGTRDEATASVTAQ